MKTLILMRHAKSSQKTAGQADHDRPLNHRGRRDAPRMAQRLRNAGMPPDEVFGSSATRVRETWELMSPEFSDETTVTFTDRLYLATPQDILEVAATADHHATCLLMIGHNPGMESLISRLTGLANTMPTAAVAPIELAIDEWPEIRDVSGGRLVDFWYPKDRE